MSIVNYKKKEKLELDFFDQKDFALLLKNCTCSYSFLSNRKIWLEEPISRTCIQGWSVFDRHSESRCEITHNG